MSTLVQGKYQLKSLHEEIDLFDRKLAHLLRFGEFSTEADREEAARKLAAKRTILANRAIKLMQDGVEFNATNLPRSFRDAATIPEASAKSAAIEPEPPVPAEMLPQAVPSHTQSTSDFPYANTALDVRTNLLEYKLRKKKA